MPTPVVTKDPTSLADTEEFRAQAEAIMRANEERELTRAAEAKERASHLLEELVVHSGSERDAAIRESIEREKKGRATWQRIVITVRPPREERAPRSSSDGSVNAPTAAGQPYDPPVPPPNIDGGNSNPGSSARSGRHAANDSSSGSVGASGRGGDQKGRSAVPVPDRPPPRRKYN